MSEVWRALGREFCEGLREARPGWAPALGLIVLATLGKPFAAVAALPLLLEVLTWGGAIFLGAIVALLLRAALRLWRRDLAASRETLLVSVALASIYAPGLWLVLARVGPAPNPVYTLSLVLAAALTLSVLRDAVAPPAKPVARRDRLYDRLDVAGPARILRLSSADHHVVVVLSDGQTLRLRLRLRDAVAEMDVTAGFCVHRSHWVALSAIRAVEAMGPRERVVLTSGDTVPVGPKYRHNLVSAGMLTD
jgi:hypothetical protein